MVVAALVAGKVAERLTADDPYANACSASVDPRPSSTGSSPARLSADSERDRRFLYVVASHRIGIYDIDHGHRLVQRIAVKQLVQPRGVIASPETRRLFVACGSNGRSTGTIIALDLITSRTIWAREYPDGADSGAVTRDGRTLYSPSGTHSQSGRWNIIDAASGDVTGMIDAGRGPHNTIVGLDGRFVYLAGRADPYLYVASTRTNRVVRKIGPLMSGGRPFTINGRQSLVFTTANQLLGFQVSSITTGRVLYTVRVSRFPFDPEVEGLDETPSHGIALSPDETRLYVIDTENEFVHVYLVSGLPARKPREFAHIRLSRPIDEGWLQLSRDGRYLYVGDAGDVIDTKSLKRVANLDLLRRTAQSVEIGWRKGVPVGTSTRYGLGHVHD